MIWKYAQSAHLSAMAERTIGNAFFRLNKTTLHPCRVAIDHNTTASYLTIFLSSLFSQHYTFHKSSYL